MIRYVDIDAFEEELRKETADYSELEQRSGEDYSWMWRKKFYEVFNNFPTIDLEEIKHGYWDGDSCSVCWFSWCDITYDIPHIKTSYCPMCGAKMDLEENNG